MRYCLRRLRLLHSKELQKERLTNMIYTVPREENIAKMHKYFDRLFEEFVAI
jgi:hypothetical protein